MAEKQPDLPPAADEESGVMGLTEVEPSPVDETPAEYKNDYFPSTQAAGTSALGLGNHGPAYYRTSSECILKRSRTDTGAL